MRGVPSNLQLQSTRSAVGLAQLSRKLAWPQRSAGLIPLAMDSTLSLSRHLSSTGQVVVEVTTLSSCSAAVGESRHDDQPSARTASNQKNHLPFHPLLEGCAPWPPMKTALHEQLMNVKASIASKLILSANLAELARPVGKDAKNPFNEIRLSASPERS